MKPTALQVEESDRHSERDSQEGGAPASPLTWFPPGKQMLHQGRAWRALEELPNLLSILGKSYWVKLRPEMQDDVSVV